MPTFFLNTVNILPKNWKNSAKILLKIIQILLRYCQTPVLGLGLGVDFTFAWDNPYIHNHKNDKNDNNPHLNFVKGTVLGEKEQGVRIRDKV